MRQLLGSAFVRGPSSLFRGLKPLVEPQHSSSANPHPVRGPSSLFRGLKPRVRSRPLRPSMRPRTLLVIQRTETLQDTLYLHRSGATRPRTLLVIQRTETPRKAHVLFDRVLGPRTLLVIQRTETSASPSFNVASLFGLDLFYQLQGPRTLLVIQRTETRKGTRRIYRSTDRPRTLLVIQRTETSSPSTLLIQPLRPRTLLVIQRTETAGRGKPRLGSGTRRSADPPRYSED